MPPNSGSDGVPSDSNSSPGAKSTASSKSPAGQTPTGDKTGDVFDDSRNQRGEGAPEGDKTGDSTKDGSSTDKTASTGGTDGAGTNGADKKDGTGSTDGSGTDAANSTASADGKGGNGTDKNGTGSKDGKAGTGTASDGELDKALGDLDGTILSERGTIQEHAKDGGADDTGDASSHGAGGTNKSGNAGASGGGMSTAANGTSTSGAGHGATNGPPTGPNIPDAPPPPSATTAQTNALPADLPGAKDDDVIARQLREAAMNEPDPVLKEKPWEEYRRYKAGS